MCFNTCYFIDVEVEREYMESDIATFTAEELRQFLISKGVCQEVAVEFESNMVSGDMPSTTRLCRVRKT